MGKDKSAKIYGGISINGEKNIRERFKNLRWENY